MRTFLFRTSLLCLSGLLVSCGGGGGSSSATAPAATAEWTYMVYLAGDNNLSAAAIADINEMEQSGSSDKVNVVVQAEFSPTYTPSVPGLTKSHSPAVRDGINIGIGIPGAANGFASVRGRIIRDFDPAWISSPLQSLGSNVDMGKAQTLTDFINWSKQNYPARNYALVLWSHGDGWKVKRDVGGVITRGALADDTSGSFMSVPVAISWPLSSTAMVSACRIVDRRCAMITVVRLCISSCRASCTSEPVAMITAWAFFLRPARAGSART